MLLRANDGVTDKQQQSRCRAALSLLNRPDEADFAEIPARARSQPANLTRRAPEKVAYQQNKIAFLSDLREYRRGRSVWFQCVFSTLSVQLGAVSQGSRPILPVAESGRASDAPAAMAT